MKIQTLRLQNYRKFEDVTLQFHPQFNILIGENGCGKTTVCQAIVTILRLPVQVLASKKLEVGNIQNDVRYSFPQELSKELHFPLQLTAKMKPSFVNPHKNEWGVFQTAGMTTAVFTDNSRGISGTQDNGLFCIHSLKELRSSIANGNPKVVIPLITHYGVLRAKRLSTHKFENVVESRFDSYKNCLGAKYNTGSFFNWLYRHFLIEIDEKQEDILLQTIRQAIQQAVPDCKNIRYHPKTDDVIVSLANEQTYSFYDLSDGFWGMIGMVADIAHRMAKLNPQLGKDVLKETPGIVIVDELDLHLHPKWQRSVAETLRAIFPKVQFIATTHSPFIIQSARDGEIIDLNQVGHKLTDFGEYQGVAFPGPKEQYDNKGIEEIAEEIQNVDDAIMSERRKKMYETAKEYYRLLHTAEAKTEYEKKDVKNKLDKLIEPYMDNVAYRAFLEMERAATNK